MNDEVEYYQRIYSLQFKDGKYAWTYDDTGANRFGDMTFESQKEAQQWWRENYGKHRVKFST